MDFKKIEERWQRRWEEKRIFEADVEKRKKFFTSLIIPYINSDLHIGHGFTYTRTDAYARFKRMQGYNVLLAQGFHATGEPILGAVERLKSGDRSQIATFQLFGSTDEDLKKFIDEGPEFVARYWMDKIIKTAKSMGFSVDWRRTFITALDPCFNRFIEWQYNTLRKKGYITLGTHPVIYCPHCESPTGDHDRLEGEGESPIDYILLKFRLVDEFIGYDSAVIYLPTATLRPETIYGVVNIWVNPDVEYVLARVNNELWIISEPASEKLKDQLKDVEIIERIFGHELLGKRCVDPISNKEIPILPANFVDPSSATGIVMSVPSHAPYDYIGIKELLDKLEQFGVTKDELEPISIIKTEGFGEHPAIEICKKMDIENQKQRDKLDNATSTIYKREFHLGILKDNCGEYSGMKVSEVKERLVRDFIFRNIADIMWDCGHVVCRCTTKCHVKIVENQWFLKFSDEKWKNNVKNCLAKMKIYPEEARIQFLNTIDWLKDKACTRKTGLGTKLPWDKEWIVETLSDSTIYMAYYTISRIINEKRIPANKLTDEVFDFIFLNKGNLRSVARKSKLNPRLIKEMKNEFEYFYPVDMRNSGKDLIQNHLTFYLFHHTALFQENKWPKMISVNGFVNVEGEKMSKSKGNFLPLRNLLNEFGADLVRMNIISSAEGLDDADWRIENIKGYRTRLEFLFYLVENLRKMKTKKLRNVDRWLLSKMQNYIKNAEEHYEQLKFRTVTHHSLFEPMKDLKWYFKRVGKIENANKKVLLKFLSDVIKLLTPIIPHVCEELWSKLGKRTFISLEKFPKPNKKLINEKAEKNEEFIERTLEDIEHIKRIVKRKPNKISLFIAETKKFKNPKEKKNQFSVLKEAKDFFERELDCKIEIIDADKSEHEKAEKALPERLGILLD